MTSLPISLSFMGMLQAGDPEAAASDKVVVRVSTDLGEEHGLAGLMGMRVAVVRMFVAKRVGVPPRRVTLLLNGVTPIHDDMTLGDVAARTEAEEDADYSVQLRAISEDGEGEAAEVGAPAPAAGAERPYEGPVRVKILGAIKGGFLEIGASPN